MDTSADNQVPAPAPIPTALSLPRDETTWHLVTSRPVAGRNELLSAKYARNLIMRQKWRKWKSVSMVLTEDVTRGTVPGNQTLTWPVTLTTAIVILTFLWSTKLTLALWRRWRLDALSISTQMTRPRLVSLNQSERTQIMYTHSPLKDFPKPPSPPPPPPPLVLMAVLHSVFFLDWYQKRTK